MFLPSFAVLAAVPNPGIIPATSNPIPNNPLPTSPQSNPSRLTSETNCDPVPASPVTPVAIIPTPEALVNDEITDAKSAAIAAASHLSADVISSNPFE